MRTSRLILTIGGLLACSIFLIGHHIPKPVEEVEAIYGPWKNRDYDVIENKYAKIEFKDDKIWYTYNTTTSKEPTEIGTYTIVEGWRVSGSTYYKVIRTTDDEIIQYELYRFSKLFGRFGHYGKVLEIINSTEDFPTEINPNSSTYSILYQSQFIRRLVIIFIWVGIFGFIHWAA